MVLFQGICLGFSGDFLTDVNNIIELMGTAIKEAKKGNVKKGKELLIRAFRLVDSSIETEKDFLTRNKLLVLREEILKLLNLFDKMLVKANE